jgi:signal transduction histidine kinase/AmiR/NasT family two-component response regulator/HPt (histidine-containing phosphotransfer) domain-containing protein
MRFRDFSIKSKLTILAVTSAAVALTFCCVGFGALLLRSSTGEPQSQLYECGKISFFVLVLSLNVAVFITGWMQKAVAQPIRDLAETARRISEDGDYSVRRCWVSRDEIGELYRAFNLMLGQIEASEAALQAAHGALEERVQIRTAELQSEIFEREKVQADLEHARDAAESANWSKSRFLANMSHEIRTPLNAVLGFTDLLQMGGDDGDPAKRHEYLGLIHTSGEHLLGLINDILDLSKIESGKLEIERVACSPQQILADVVSVLRVRANEKGIALEYAWESGVPQMVEADPQRLRQLLVNLVGNAVKFTDNGHVRVVGRMLHNDGHELLAFDVIDTGVGIPKDKFEAIFDPFVQADNSVTRKFGGTGLGLAICRRIVEAMGGTLTVQSEVGKGTVFTATAEVKPSPEAPLADATQSDVITAVRRKAVPGAVEVPRGRVLVVEDGDTNRKLIDLILRRAGLDVVTAENGKLGVEAALASSFDLILMDMQMPVMDGYTAARTLRDHGLEMPIIALTAHAMSGDEQKCRAAGCSGFMTKPIHADLLLQTAAAAIMEWQARGNAACEVAQASRLPLRGRKGTCSTTDAIFSELPTDDPDIREIVEEFIDCLHAKLPAMQDANARGDLAELARLAHWLKGSGGSAGFPALTAPARNVEKLARDAQCDAIESALAELAEISARISKPLQVEASP